MEGRIWLININGSADLYTPIHPLHKSCVKFFKPKLWISSHPALVNKTLLPAILKLLDCADSEYT